MCKSSFCVELSCYGIPAEKACWQHEDCAPGNYCFEDTSWPFETTCKPQLELDGECSSDFQCENYLFCWFKSAVDKIAGTKRCIETYSQVDDTTFGW